MSRPCLANPSDAPHVRIAQVQLLAQDWFTLKKTTFDLRRRDGTWQRQSRETYDRGNGAVVLLFNTLGSTVLLTRQFRFPAFANGHADGHLIEACAGLLDGADPARRIEQEILEELGYHIQSPRKLFEAYMSPGSVTEKLHFFAAHYTPHDRVEGGGGLLHEGEDIEVLELPFAQALEMLDHGEIEDGKTIMLLQYAALRGLKGLEIEEPAVY
jgi:GDP-mannose pyrophosphatase NudK